MLHERHDHMRIVVLFLRAVYAPTTLHMQHIHRPRTFALFSTSPGHCSTCLPSFCPFRTYRECRMRPIWSWVEHSAHPDSQVSGDSTEPGPFDCIVAAFAVEDEEFLAIYWLACMYRSWEACETEQELGLMMICRNPNQYLLEEKLWSTLVLELDKVYETQASRCS